MSMKVIITGSNGFVGRNLSKYLTAEGIGVRPVSLRQAAGFNTGVEDALIHLAGKAHDTKNTAAENEYYEVNTHLTRKVFDTFLNSDIADFFYFSSVKAVADTVD